jgi:hypothetical protein
MPPRCETPPNAHQTTLKTHQIRHKQRKRTIKKGVTFAHEGSDENCVNFGNNDHKYNPLEPTRPYMSA